MLNDDEDPKDWEREDVEPPENLKREWVVRDHFGEKQVPCPSCQNLVDGQNLQCPFCGAQILHDTGLLGRILKGFKKLFWG